MSSLATRAFMLLFLFCVDVHVKADSGAQVISAAHKKSFATANVSVVMQAGSLLEQREDNLVHLVKGHFFVDLQPSGKVQTAFATMTCAVDSCQALVRRDSEKVEIKAVKGEFNVRRLGEKAAYGLRSGMQVTVMAVTDEGTAEMEFPQSLPWDSTVKEWSKFYSGNAKDFRTTLIQFREEWKAAVENVSQLHQIQAGRVIASYEQSLSEQRARQAVQEREDAKMRKLFREKNDLAP